MLEVFGKVEFQTRGFAAVQKGGASKHYENQSWSGSFQISDVPIFDLFIVIVVCFGLLLMYPTIGKISSEFSKESRIYFAPFLQVLFDVFSTRQ